MREQLSRRPNVTLSRDADAGRRPLDSTASSAAATTSETRVRPIGTLSANFLTTITRATRRLSISRLFALVREKETERKGEGEQRKRTACNPVGEIWSLRKSNASSSNRPLGRSKIQSSIKSRRTQAESAKIALIL